MERPDFERCCYKRHIQDRKKAYCGRDITLDNYYFEDIQHTKEAAKHDYALCTDCSIAIDNIIKAKDEKV